MDIVVNRHLYTSQFSHLREVSLCSKQQLMQKLTVKVQRIRICGVLSPKWDTRITSISSQCSVLSGTLGSHPFPQSTQSSVGHLDHTPLVLWQREQKGYQGKRLGRTGGWQCLLDMAGPGPSQTCSSYGCLHKTRTRSSHSTFQHGEGRCPEFHPSTRSC